MLKMQLLKSAIRRSTCLRSFYCEVAPSDFLEARIHFMPTLHGIKGSYKLLAEFTIQTSSCETTGRLFRSPDCIMQAENQARLAVENLREFSLRCEIA